MGNYHSMQDAASRAAAQAEYASDEARNIFNRGAELIALYPKTVMWAVIAIVMVGLYNVL